MKVLDETLVEAIAEYYRQSSGNSSLIEELAVQKFIQVKEILDHLEGDGISDLDSLRIATQAFEKQVKKDLK